MMERRIETRMLCADLVDFHWKDPNGRKRRGVANLEDISVSGACLQVDRPIPLGTIIHMSYPNGELSGILKYCAFREIGYFLGVEFDSDSRWSQTEFRPRHMLDPRVLITRPITSLVADAPLATVPDPAR